MLRELPVWLVGLLHTCPMTPPGRSIRHALPARVPGTRLLVALAAAVALTSGLLAVVVSPRADAVEPLSPAFDGLAQGIDASSWQHPHGAAVTWQAAADSGQSFAFIKATEGSGPANRYYEADVTEARAAGMAVGSYHKARPAMDPAMQAHAFASRLQSVGGPQLPPVLDLETDEGRSPEELIGWTRVFLDTLRHLTGRTPIIYTYRYFWLDRMGNTAQFAEYPLWLAEYGVSEPTLPVIGGWSEWLLWQRADNGAVPGFSDAVDLNVFAGSREELGAWLGPAAPEPAPAAPPAVEQPAPVAEPAVEQPAPVAEPAVEQPAPEAITVALPPDLPVPDGFRLPETITVPGGLLDTVPPPR